MIYADDRHVQTKIPVDDHKKLRMFCLENELNLNTLLSQILAEWIKNNITLKEVKNGEEKNDQEN